MQGRWRMAEKVEAGGYHELQPSYDRRTSPGFSDSGWLTVKARRTFTHAQNATGDLLVWLGVRMTLRMTLRTSLRISLSLDVRKMM
jgi:hypothetical protein